MELATSLTLSRQSSDAQGFGIDPKLACIEQASHVQTGGPGAFKNFHSLAWKVALTGAQM